MTTVTHDFSRPLTALTSMCGEANLPLPLGYKSENLMYDPFMPRPGCFSSYIFTGKKGNGRAFIDKTF